MPQSRGTQNYGFYIPCSEFRQLGGGVGESFMPSRRHQTGGFKTRPYAAYKLTGQGKHQSVDFSRPEGSPQFKIAQERTQCLPDQSFGQVDLILILL
jgi:hypothetical protein